jgi:hypothetical protein
MPGPHQMIVHEVGQLGFVVDGEDLGNRGHGGTLPAPRDGPVSGR